MHLILFFFLAGLLSPQNIRISDEWYTRFRVAWDPVPSPILGYKIVYKVVGKITNAGLPTCKYGFGTEYYQHLSIIVIKADFAVVLPERPLLTFPKNCCQQNRNSQLDESIVWLIIKQLFMLTLTFFFIFFSSSKVRMSPWRCLLER